MSNRELGENRTVWDWPNVQFQPATLEAWSVGKRLLVSAAILVMLPVIVIFLAALALLMAFLPMADAKCGRCKHEKVVSKRHGSCHCELCGQEVAW